MKKINKTLLLASTLFVSQAVTLTDNAFADGVYDLNVEVGTESNIDANSNEEVQPISQAEIENTEVSTNENEAIEQDSELETKNEDNNQKDLQEQTPAEENPADQSQAEKTETGKEVSEENEEDISKEKELVEVKNESQEENPSQNSEALEEENQEVEEENDLEVYDDTNLDDILTMIEEVDEKSTEKTQRASEESQTASKETEIEEKVYYSPKATGVIVEEKDTTKYYEDNKLVKNAQVIVNDKFYNIDSKGNATNPKAYWTVMGADLYYSDENGNISKGIKEIKNKKYYFNQDGILQINRIIVTGQSHYDIGSDGEMIAPKNSWTTINNNKYYNDNNGKLLKGVGKIGNKYYYFNDDGILTTNKKVLTDSRFYTVDKNGLATNRKNYWFNIGGNTYRTGKDGRILTGLYKEGKNTYVFANDGILFQNTSMISGGKFYNIDNRGLVTIPKNSWVTYNGQKYHTNANGYVKEGVWKIDNKYYYFTSNGLTGNQKVTQKGVVYNVDANGIATKEDNNIPGEKSIDKVMEWMFNARSNGLTYNMGAARNSSYAADCSSAVYRSLIYGGFLDKGHWVGNTETLFQLGAKGKVMYEIKESDIQYGDIFVAGNPGGSMGAAGHTGYILNPSDDTIIHMTYSKNGVAVTPRKGYMGDSRGLPVKYFRLVGANSAKTYLNKK